MSDSQQEPPNAPNQAGAKAKASSATSRTFVWLCGLLVLVALYVVVAARNQTKNGAQSVAVGKKLPALALSPLTGDGRDLTIEQLDGRVTMINFWGAWCPPCVREFPHMVRMRDELSVHDDFQFVSVSCLQRPSGNESDLREQTLTFMERINARLPTHSDLNVESRLAVASTLDIDSLPFPATVLIDRERVIQGLWLGYLPGDEDDMKEAAMKVLMSAP